MYPLIFFSPESITDCRIKQQKSTRVGALFSVAPYIQTTGEIGHLHVEVSGFRVFVVLR